MSYFVVIAATGTDGRQIRAAFDKDGVLKTTVTNPASWTIVPCAENQDNVKEWSETPKKRVAEYETHPDKVVVTLVGGGKVTLFGSLVRIKGADGVGFLSFEVL